jgi:uncharacterized protein YqeY
MGMLETISEDLKAAMKGGDKLRLETLRSIRAALLEKQVEKRPHGGITAEDEMAVLISSSKKRKESISIFRANGREDLAGQEEKELAIIGEYLPKQLGAEEVTGVIKRIIAEMGASSQKDFGKVMPSVMKELKGKADGKLIQETVKQLLGP